MDGAPHDPPQHIAAILVRGHDAVGNQRGGSPGMVGEDPHRARGGLILVVGTTRQLLREVDQGPERVGVEDGRNVLEDRGHPLEPHARIDVLLRQL